MPGLTPFIAAVLAAANATIWVMLRRRRIRHGMLVDYEPRRCVPWTGIDLVLIAMIFMAGQCALASLHLDVPDADRMHEDRKASMAKLPTSLMARAIVSVLTVASAVVVLRQFRDADARDLGFDASRLRGDIRLGIAAFAAVSVPVYAMQLALVQFVLSKHPLVEVLQHNGDPGWRLCLSSAISAVIVAPLVEEFLFRVVLQGWLESLVQSQYEGAPASRGAVVHLPPRRFWTPIVFSSAAFALMHASHGPDVLPLFFFALALGYLYQQTHRIWPSLVVHLSLNACTLASLFSQIA
jgi:membrane protease YdiL (CAAX protease family)